MLNLDNVSKSYPTKSGLITVLDTINLTIEKGEKVGILGRNGAGKSTLVRLIGGAEPPSSGTIVKDMSVSWPIAFAGGFQGTLTGMDNLRFLCRVYERDIQEVKEFVDDFAELGRYMHEPTKSYSSGMKARLNFGLSMAFEFDCYLIDEVMAVGDQKLREKCRYELFEKRKDRSIILVSHNANEVRRICDKAVVLVDGKMMHFDSVDEAYEYYNPTQKVMPKVNASPASPVVSAQSQV